MGQTKRTKVNITLKFLNSHQHERGCLFLSTKCKGKHIQNMNGQQTSLLTQQYINILLGVYLY